MTTEQQPATVLFLNPGAMGARMAGECRAERKIWVSQGRSAATSDRATAEGLESMVSLKAAVDCADVVVSICPPASAMDVATSVAAHNFCGLYLDANAISPATMARVTKAFEATTARVVDGGVIGPPPGKPGTTRLYLHAQEQAAAERVAAMWADSMLDAVVMDTGAPDTAGKGVGSENLYAASALKMAYAAWTKGSAAQLLAVSAAAKQFGVSGYLNAEWDISQPGLFERARQTSAGVGPKAWRFTGEMAEIVTAFEQAGVPADFWVAAGDVYDRLAPLKSVANPPLAEAVQLIARRVSD